jgi:phosphoglycerate kinase
MAIKYVDEIELQGKRVVARFDFNVPFSKENPKEISDTTRIDRALPTIKHMLEQGVSKLVLMSHLGRPKGEAKPEFSLEPVAKCLAEKLGADVILTETAIDAGVKQTLELPSTRIVLLQNLRYHKEETENDSDFAKKLASYGEIFVNDAFGTAHRKHASTYGIVAHTAKNCAVGGFLLKKETEALTQVCETPQKPFVAIVGGAKVSDKIKIIEKLLTNVDKMLIGGAMAYPFLKAAGKEIGSSMCSDEDVTLAKQILGSSGGSKIELPTDHIGSTEFNGTPEEISGVDIPEGKMGLDIGPKTLEAFKSRLATAKTVLWNGPMGVFENDDYNKGTFSIARTLAELDAYTLIGGGDSVSAVNKSGIADKMSHVSTGGGASLEFLEQGTLPGIQALKFGIN